MTVFLVTRHSGAVQWIAARGIVVDQHCPHLDPAEIGAGDTVIGTLPVHLAASICARGGRYVHLSIDLQSDARGRELGADELDRYGARLDAFEVRAIAGAKWQERGAGRD